MKGIETYVGKCTMFTREILSKTAESVITAICYPLVTRTRPSYVTEAPEKKKIRVHIA